MWQRLRASSWSHHQFTARWIDVPEVNIQNPYADEHERQWDPDVLREHWIMDAIDVTGSDAVVCYQGVEPLRGALVEAGMAIALGIPVIAVGDVYVLGSWVYHPTVRLVPVLSDALKALDAMDKVRGEAA
jgi:nucleoside 2-deoxyribosyltransferase